MYQKLTIVGHLGRDPELRYTPSGQAVCNYSVATSRYWTGSDGQKQEETVWFRVTTWGKRAEIDNQYLQKGSLVLCEGRLTVDRESGGPRVWQTQDGKWRASYEMTADLVKFLSGRGEGNSFDNGAQNSTASTSSFEDAAITEDEIPF
jgi:single-strand DNA-binding protein